MHGFPSECEIVVFDSDITNKNINELHITVDWSNMHTNTGHVTKIIKKS